MSELNLLPYELRHKNQEPLKSKQIIVISIAAVAIISAAIVIPMTRISSLKKQKESLEGYVASNSSILTENQKLQNDINDYNQYVTIADNTRDTRVLSAGIIRNIEKYIPSQVVLSGLSYSQGLIQINATSSDYNAICEFSANLQTSEDFAGSMINMITNATALSGGSTGYTTSITISLTGGEAVEGTQP